MKKVGVYFKTNYYLKSIKEENLKYENKKMEILLYSEPTCMPNKGINPTVGYCGKRPLSS